MLKTHRVAVALLAGLLVALAGSVRAADYQSYIPADTEAVIKLNFKQVLASPLLKDAIAGLKAEMTTGKGAKLKELGFNPFTDLEHIVIAVPGGDPEKTVVLVQGKFNVAKIEAAVEGAGKADLKVHKVGANKVFEGKVPLPQVGERDLFFGFVDNTTIALAPSKDNITATLDRKNGKTKGSLKKEMKDLLSKMDNKLTLAIAVLGTVAGQADVSDRVNSITGGVSLVNDVNLDLVVAAKNVDTAKELEMFISQGLDQAKQLLPVIAANQKQLTPIVDLIDAIKVTTAGSNVHIKGQLSKEDIEKALKKAGG